MSAPQASALDADLAALADVRAKARQARRAFLALADADQPALDRIVRQMAEAGTAAAAELAELAVQETGYGVYEHKIIKNRYNTGFVARWMLERRAVGVLWVDQANRVTAVGSPMGVLAGIIPVTNPTSTVLFKSLAAVKAGNAIVHAPHPRAARCSQRAAAIMADAAAAAGAPEGLVSCLSQPTLAATQELMRRDRDRLGAGHWRAGHGPRRVLQREADDCGWCGQRPGVRRGQRGGCGGSRGDDHHLEVV